MKHINSNAIKKTCIVLSVVLFSMSHKSFAFSGDELNKSTKKAKVLSQQIINSSDSLKSISKTQIQQKDSVSSPEKSNTNSGASYNILFQVIYRNSFSEIFEERK